MSAAEPSAKRAKFSIERLTLKCLLDGSTHVSDDGHLLQYSEVIKDLIGVVAVDGESNEVICTSDMNDALVKFEICVRSPFCHPTKLAAYI